MGLRDPQKLYPGHCLNVCVLEKRVHAFHQIPKEFHDLEKSFIPLKVEMDTLEGWREGGGRRWQEPDHEGPHELC